MSASAFQPPHISALNPSSRLSLLERDLESARAQVLAIPDLVRDVSEIKEIIGKPPNQLTGFAGSGMCGALSLALNELRASSLERYSRKEADEKFRGYAKWILGGLGSIALVVLAAILKAYLGS